jgi:hypothetical protein
LNISFCFDSIVCKLEIQLFSLINRMPNSFGLILLTISKRINSPQHETSFKNILNLVLQANFITEDDSVTIMSVVDGNMNWLEKNLHEIEMYLDVETPTDSTPIDTSSTSDTSVTPTSTQKSETSDQPTSTESTTLGASSLIASFTAFVLCAVVRLIT